MGVGGHRVPIHLVDPRIQGLEAHTHCVVVDLRFALADFSTVSVCHRQFSVTLVELHLELTRRPG